MPALPAYIELSDEAAPMKFAGMVDVAFALPTVPLSPNAVVVVEPVPTAVGAALMVLLKAG